MDLKEDIKEAKERMAAWWNHELIDRPVISYYFPKRSGSIGGYLDALGQDWSLAQNFDDLELFVNGFEKRAIKTYYGGESIPSLFPNYGPGIVAAVFGVIPQFKSETMWFSRPTKPEDIIQLLENTELNMNNEWYARLLRITTQGSERAAQMGYQFSITDVGGVLDILSSFLGPTDLILTMKRQPQIIDNCRQIILEKLLKIYDDLYAIIKKNCNGFNAWLNVWCPKSWYPTQCDFIAMLNPKWFKRFVLPDLVTQIEHMDYAIHHMDGPYQIPFLDDLLAIDHLSGIQWVPGAGRPPQGSDDWMPIYRKIQQAGKNVVIDSLPEDVPHLYKHLDPKGLYVRAGFASEISANFYLPSFIGGQDGELIQKALTWVKQNNISRFDKEELKNFLGQAKLEFDPKTEKQLFKEIKNCMREKLFFT